MGWALGAPAGRFRLDHARHLGLGERDGGSAESFLGVAVLAVLPLAFGAFSLGAPGRWRPISPRAWRALAALGVLALFAAGAAALAFGPAEWRLLTALRYETRGERLAGGTRPPQ